MEHNITIGIYIAAAVAVMVVIHSWLYKIVKFKMDESMILRLFKESGSDCDNFSTTAIASATKISESRVTTVCIKSKIIKTNAGKIQSWHI